MGQNAVTGEHTCMVIKPLNNDDVEFGEFFTRYYNGELPGLGHGNAYFVSIGSRYFNCKNLFSFDNSRIQRKVYWTVGALFQFHAF